MSGLVPLTSSFSNIQQFVPSLFDSTVRSVDNVVDAVQDGDLWYAFADSNSQSLILNSWLAAWQQSQGDSYDSTAYNRCPATDRTVLAILANYIKAHSLSLAIPTLTATNEHESGTNKYAYENTGYGHEPFFDSNGQWYYGTIDSSGNAHKGSYDKASVANFLFYFFYGAHFVIPSSATDNGGTGFQSLYSSIQSTFTYVYTGPSTPPALISTPWRTGVINSHYVATSSGGHQLWINTSGMDYLTITSDQEPSSNPLICAMLVGVTSDGSDTNTFLQLEGWQEHGTGGGWHGADYDSHEDTLWNFSTFGASVYSEKRCAPLFLYGPNFSLKIKSDTHMPHYVGAGSKQNWMRTDLMIVSS